MKLTATYCTMRPLATHRSAPERCSWARALVPPRLLSYQVCSHRLRLTQVAGFVDVAATVSQKRGYVSVSLVPVGGLGCPTVPLLQLPLSNATVFVRVFSALVLFQPVAVCLRARVGWFSALRP